MKKRALLILLLPFLACHLAANAQGFSFSDLFGQQGKKEKLMAAQVSGIYLYLGALKGGYNIMHKGLDLSHELKGGTFSLHTEYFNSLEQVNPVVRQNPKGKAIADLSIEISNRFNSELAWQKKQQQLKPTEMAYLQKVCDNLRQLAEKDLSEATDILTPGKLQLTDQQRLDRLDKLYAAIKDKAAFASSFTAKCRSLARNRLRAQSDQKQLRKLYGIQ